MLLHPSFHALSQPFMEFALSNITNAVFPMSSAPSRPSVCAASGPTASFTEAAVGGSILLLDPVHTTEEVGSLMDLQKAYDAY